MGPSAFGELGISTYTLVPLDKVDLSLVSVLYMKASGECRGGWAGARGAVLRARLLLLLSVAWMPHPHATHPHPALPQGDYAAVTPVFGYAMEDDVGAPIESAFSAWRPLLRWLGPPGLLMAALALFTIEEPRQRGRSGRFMPLVTLGRDSVGAADLATPIGQLGQERGGNGSAGGAGSADDVTVQQILGGSAAAAAAAGLAGTGAGAGAAAVALPPGSLVSASEQEAPASVGESLGKLRGLVASPAFLALTLSAALNDVGSWALVSWQATFYQRVYELEPSTYAPLLAVVIPVGGIIGGVGAGACWWGGQGGDGGVAVRVQARSTRGGHTNGAASGARSACCEGAGPGPSISPHTTARRRIWRPPGPHGRARLADRGVCHGCGPAHRAVPAGTRLQAVVCGAAGGLCAQVRAMGAGGGCSWADVCGRFLLPCSTSLAPQAVSSGVPC